MQESNRKLDFHDDWHSDIYMNVVGFDGECDIIFAKLIAHASREKKGRRKTVYRAYFSVIKNPGDGVTTKITLDLKLKILKHNGSLSPQRYTNKNSAIRDIKNEIRKRFNVPKLIMKAEELFVGDEINNFLTKYDQ